MFGALVVAAACAAPTGSATTASPTTATTQSVAPSPSASGTPRPSASPAGETEPFVRALVPRWVAAGPTLFVDRRPGVGQGHVIVAVPLGGGAAVDIAGVSSDIGEWDVRSDSGAIVVASTDHCTNGSCAPGPNRLAVLDLAAGRAKWITVADGTTPVSPVWSPDGAFIYYGAVDSAQADLGIFRIKADGSERTRVTDPVPPQPAPFGGRSSSSRPHFVTTKDTLLWTAVVGDRTTLRARDLGTRTDATFVSDEPCVAVLAWRAAPPSALVRHGSCQTQTARLLLWNLGTGAASVVVDQPDYVFDAAWDAAGQGIAASIARPPDFRSELALINTAGRATVPGGDAAGELEWTTMGVAFAAAVNGAGADCPFGLSEIRVVVPGRPASTSLYRGCGVTHLRAAPAR